MPRCIRQNAEISWKERRWNYLARDARILDRSLVGISNEINYPRDAFAEIALFTFLAARREIDVDFYGAKY